MLLPSFIARSARIRFAVFPQRSPPPPNLGLKFFALSSFATSSSGPTPYQKLQMSAKDLVESAIANNKVAIFSKTWCPYCKKAKHALKEAAPESDIVIYELDEREDGDAIQNYLLQKTGQRTVPNIFISRAHIGGNDNLQEAMRNGKVRELLAQ